MKRRSLSYNIVEPPKQTGVYACRVECEMAGLFEDAFLLWDDNAKRWSYLSSDQHVRKYVAGWIGPLQRLHPHHLPSSDFLNK